jgi:hypothetical protein
MPLTHSIRHDRTSAAALISQICARCGLCCHSSLGMQSGGSACALGIAVRHLEWWSDRRRGGLSPAASTADGAVPAGACYGAVSAMATVSMPVAGRSGPPRARLCCIVVRGPASGTDCYASPGGTPASSATVRSACCGVCGVSRGGPGFARESLSEVAAAAPMMASPVPGLPAPDGPALEAGSPVTNDPGSGG